MIGFARFLTVGGGATALHAAAALLYHALGASPLWSNFFAYLTAFALSFTGNWRWTFEGRSPAWRSLGRFLIVSLSCFAINHSIVFVVTGPLGLPLWLALIPVVIVSPAIAFIVGKHWAFSPAGNVAA
jgi:putative flippase GtrA